MKQLTLRVPDDLVVALKRASLQRGQSVNGFAQLVLSAAVDPVAGGTEVERIRERLARVGLLAEHDPVAGARPSSHEVAAARTAAGHGRALSDLISEDRG